MSANYEASEFVWEREEFESGFLMVDNRVARDAGLSGNGFKLHCWIRTNVPGFHITFESIMAGVGLGRQALRSALANLQERGYLEVSPQHRLPNGRLSGRVYHLRNPWKQGTNPPGAIFAPGGMTPQNSPGAKIAPGENAASEGADETPFLDGNQAESPEVSVEGAERENPRKIKDLTGGGLPSTVYRPPLKEEIKEDYLTQVSKSSSSSLENLTFEDEDDDDDLLRVVEDEPDPLAAPASPEPEPDDPRPAALDDAIEQLSRVMARDDAAELVAMLDEASSPRFDWLEVDLVSAVRRILGRVKPGRKIANPVAYIFTALTAEPESWRRRTKQLPPDPLAGLYSPDGRDHAHRWETDYNSAGDLIQRCRWCHAVEVLEDAATNRAAREAALAAMKALDDPPPKAVGF